MLSCLPGPGLNTLEKASRLGTQPGWGLPRAGPRSRGRHTLRTADCELEKSRSNWAHGPDAQPANGHRSGTGPRGLRGQWDMARLRSSSPRPWLETRGTEAFAAALSSTLFLLLFVLGVRQYGIRVCHLPATSTRWPSWPSSPMST